VVVAFPQDRRVDRLADLYWLLAHRAWGAARLGDEPFALGLAAGVLGELLTQPAGTVGGQLLEPDPVLAPVLADLAEAAGQDIVRPTRVWIEWLAQERHRRTERAVVGRLARTGLVAHRGRRFVPVDHWVAATPVTLLTVALAGSAAVTEQVRLLAGLAVSCGLAGELAEPGDNRMVSLQQLARRLPDPLLGVLAAVDDALQALAVRRR
jgi:hypothetical protein